MARTRAWIGMLALANERTPGIDICVGDEAPDADATEALGNWVSWACRNSDGSLRPQVTRAAPGPRKWIRRNLGCSPAGRNQATPVQTFGALPRRGGTGSAALHLAEELL